MDDTDKNIRHLNILLLEDSPYDVELVESILVDELESVSITHVASREDFVACLKNEKYDVVLSDYNLPGYNALEALNDCRNICPDVPFICVSGTIGEEAAVELLKQGATDYVLKDRMARLSISVKRALSEASANCARIKAEEALKKQNREYLALNEKLSKSYEKISKINAELIKSKEKAEESDRLKSAFLANMSHEIRTPLNGILGFAELLTAKNADNQSRKSYSEIIKSSSNQLLTIINNILDISLIESRQVVLKENEVNLDQLFSYLYQLHVSSCAAKNISLIKSNVDVEFTFIADDVKLKQILSNLIGNSIKFTQKGNIEFGVTKRQYELEFYVKDSGIGIPGEFHELVFERFRQVEDDASRNYGGTGLGLAIVKAYVEEMGGNIWLESEPGQGAAFFFTLPLKPDLNNDEIQQHLDDVLLTDYSGLNILIAEDEENNFLLLNEILTEFKANINWAKNGIEAIELCKKNSIDIVLMDIRMPDMDGVQATKKIKKFSKVPIIAITAYALSNDRKKFLEAGCDDYLSKPVKQSELITSINKYLVKSK